MDNKFMNRMVFGNELMRLAKHYDFMLMNADTKSFGLESFGELYPNRTFNFGIAEQNMAAASAGAALCGEKVFFATFAVFASMRACEQIRTFICYPNLNVVILASHGGLLTGADGATHIAIEDMAIMRAFPNMTIVEPSDAVCAKKLVRLALEYKGPLYIRFPKGETPIINDKSNYDIKIGKGNIIKHYGNDVAIIAIGWLLSKAIVAAERLFKEGINVVVVEMHTIKPIDKDLICDLAKKCKGIITIEDHSIIGGLGSVVAETVSENYPIKIKRIGILDNFGESGTPEELYKKNHMEVADIVNAVKEIIKNK